MHFGYHLGTVVSASRWHTSPACHLAHPALHRLLVGQGWSASTLEACRDAERWFAATPAAWFLRLVQTEPGVGWAGGSSSVGPPSRPQNARGRPRRARKFRFTAVAIRTTNRSTSRMDWLLHHKLDAGQKASVFKYEPSHSTIIKVLAGAPVCRSPSVSSESRPVDGVLPEKPEVKKLDSAKIWDDWFSEV